jgi:hypothetical protein
MINHSEEIISLSASLQMSEAQRVLPIDIVNTLPT